MLRAFEAGQRRNLRLHLCLSRLVLEEKHLHGQGNRTSKTSRGRPAPNEVSMRSYQMAVLEASRRNRHPPRTATMCLGRLVAAHSIDSFRPSEGAAHHRQKAVRFVQHTDQSLHWTPDMVVGGLESEIEMTR